MNQGEFDLTIDFTTTERKREEMRADIQKEVAYMCYLVCHSLVFSVSAGFNLFPILPIVENKAQHEATKKALQAAVSLCELTYFELFSL